MRLLLDSHILLAIPRRDLSRFGSAIDLLLKSPANEKVVSAASFWELAVKHRLKKLDLIVPPDRLPGYFQSLGYDLLDVRAGHAVESLAVAPDTRDPFDNLLLAQCQCEGLRLVTADRILTSHPLAWRP
jgi:PIN domain nuclease of toxin-antitoxin system